MVHYSGDTDGVLPTWGTKQWIHDLHWPLLKEWSQWKTDGQVSGYVEVFKGLHFFTVKGVGHMAPQWKRKPMSRLVAAIMHGEDYSNLS